MDFMKPIKLSQEEITLLENTSDIPILEVIKGMTLEELKYFDDYVPLNLEYYNNGQIKWYDKERYLIGTRNGKKEVSPLELIEDMSNNHTPNRYKAYFVLKFPDKVKRRDEVLEVIPC